MKTIFIDKSTWDKIMIFKQNNQPIVDMNKYLNNCIKDEIIILKYDNEHIYLKINDVIIFDSVKDFMIKMNISELDISVRDIKETMDLIGTNPNNKTRRVKFFKFQFSDENNFENNPISNSNLFNNNNNNDFDELQYFKNIFDDDDY
jgi:serine/threonine-protein kinase RIO1